MLPPAAAHAPAAGDTSSSTTNKDAAAITVGGTTTGADGDDDDSGTDDVNDELRQQTGWHSQRYTLSLPEAHATIKMPAAPPAGGMTSVWRIMLAWAGCGTIISVGYMCVAA